MSRWCSSPTATTPFFTEYKTIIGASHLTPREALAQAYNKNPEDMPARLSVISWILPITEKTRQSNRSQTRSPPVSGRTPAGTASSSTMPCGTMSWNS